MVLYIIMIIEGLLYVYNYVGCRGFLPYFQLLNIKNNYIRMAKGVIVQFSLIFGIMLLLLGSFFLYKRIKDSDSIIDKDNIFQQMIGFVIFFGFVLILAFI